MSLLSDERLVKEYINHDSPCPSELLIEYYLKCKKNEWPVPKKIDDFVTSCLSIILKNYNQGSKPKYDEIFSLKFARGAKGQRKSIKLREQLFVGLKFEQYMDKKGLDLSYEDAAKKIKNDLYELKGRSIDIDAIKKLYTLYNKLPETPDHEKNDPPP